MTTKKLLKAWKTSIFQQWFALKGKKMIKKRFFLITYLFYSTFSVSEPTTTFLDLPSDLMITIISKIPLYNRAHMIDVFLQLQKSAYQKSHKEETSEAWNKRLKHAAYSMLFSDACHLGVSTPEKIDLFVDGMKTNDALGSKKVQALKILKGLLQEEPQVCENLLTLHYDRFKKNILHMAVAQGDVFLIRLLFVHAEKLMFKLSVEKDVSCRTPFQVAQAAIFQTEEERKAFVEEKKELTEKQKDYLFEAVPK